MITLRRGISLGSVLLLLGCGGGPSDGEDRSGGAAGAEASGGHSDGGNGNTGGGGSAPEAPPAACGSEEFEPPTDGQTYYIAPDGSDSAAGTIDAPFLTMNRAIEVAGGGDVVYLRGGVYNRIEDVIQARGEAGNPLVIMAYPGEQPILDGDGVEMESHESVLQFYLPEHVVVSGLEIRNSASRGLQLYDAEDFVVRDCTVHDVAQKAIGLVGHDLVAEGNVVYNAVMDNANSTAGGGWASAVTTHMLDTTGSPSSNVVVRGNSISNVWGECIDALFVEGMTIAGNEVQDCYSVGVYVDTARSVRVEGNLIRATDDTYRRYGSGHLMIGILLASEAAAGESSPDFGAEQVVLANNLILGTYHGISWWDCSGNSRASNTYLGVEIVSNVIFGQEASALSFDPVPAGRTPPSDATLINNIIYDGSQAFAGDPDAWTVTSNIFPDGAPPEASDPSNIEGDPLLAGPAIDALPEDFQPSESSPCRNAGEPVASVPLDFACATRGTDTTTIGAFE